MRKSKTNIPEASNELSAGRTAFVKKNWADALRLLNLADQGPGLRAEDLEKLASSAYLVGRDSLHQSTLERAYLKYVDEGHAIDAARCAFWLGLTLLFVGKQGSATGWLTRAQRLIDEVNGECVEEGYLTIPTAERQLAATEWEAAYSTATIAVKIGDRHKDTDLVACARHQQGRALIGQGRVEDGLALLDDAMIAVTSGELSPIMTGLIYCSVIDVCQHVYALARSREWTTAMAKWCEDHPQMISFSSTCLAHRAEVMQFHGEWLDAIREAELACVRNQNESELPPPASAYYQQAEIHRLHGDFDAANIAYREASDRGFDPQPGLALLRLAEGHPDKAAAIIHRAMASTLGPLQRARLLPAHVEIMLATGDISQAHNASQELLKVAEDFDTEVLVAMAAHTEGAVQLAQGDIKHALTTLRKAFTAWQQLAAPYQTAQARVHLGMACRALGDEEGAAMELLGAQVIFEQLDAKIDLARISSLVTKTPSKSSHGLTPRELQILRIVATGKTNKSIAAELCVSEKTVDRHISNLFNKLSVSSRAAATAYAYKNKLV